MINLYKSTYFNTLDEDKELRETLREYVLDDLDVPTGEMIANADEGLRPYLQRDRDAQLKEIDKIVEERYNEQDELDYECFADNVFEIAKNNKDYLIAIGDLGLWTGRAIRYKEIGNDWNMILSSYACDYGKFYIDEGDVKFEGVHHDGTNYVTFRKLKDRVDAEGYDIDTSEILSEFDSVIYCGDRDAIQKWVAENTESIAPVFLKQYGITSEAA